MTYIFAHPTGGMVAASAVMLDAVRCWQRARDVGYPVQPRLSAILRDYGCEMLAPCFDSLVALAQLALGRRLRIGKGHIVSADEHLLLDLLAGARQPRACLACSDGVFTLLECALRSTRIMLALTVSAPCDRKMPA